MAIATRNAAPYFFCRYDYDDTRILSEQCGGNGFREYLTSSMSDMFSLDLSRCTLIECITKMCEIKSRSHPKIKQNYRMLVNKLEDIEKQFGCTIMPAMISSVFWNHFVPFLAEQGLKYSTIGHVKANLIAVLNWSSKYGVKLNPSYSEVDIPPIYQVRFR